MLPLVFLIFTFISDCLFYYRYAILFLFDFELFCSLKENKPFLNFDFYLERHYTKRRFIASSLIHVRKWTCTTWHVHIEFIGSVKGSLSLVKKSPGEKSENLKIKILCLYGNHVRWLFSRLQGIGKFVIWFTVDTICFALLTPLIYKGIWLC